MTPQPPQKCKVYTPDHLAKAMVYALGDLPNDHWLEPCVGKGVFLKALAELGVDASRITAIDLMQEPEESDTLARTVRGKDFLAWASSTQNRFTKIIGNPPYSKQSRLDPSLKKSIASIKTPEGKIVEGKANYWFAFLCASLKLLREAGSLCMVLPAAWDYADYAKSLRGSIKNYFSRVEVHRSLESMFPDAQDGCVVIIGREFGGSCADITRYEYSNSQALTDSLTSKQIGKRVEKQTEKIEVNSVNGCGSVLVKDIMNIRLGGVTGDAKYFLLTEKKRRELNLPPKSVQPVLSKANHLTRAKATTKYWQSLRDNNERVWLFRPFGKTLTHNGVKKYLHLATNKGGCNRNADKIVRRDPWYITPMPDQIDGFISGMAKIGPWICLNSMPQLAATNTLYVISFRDKLSKDEQSAWALSLLSTFTRTALKSINRVYPDGLIKFEPRDLLELPILKPTKTKGAASIYSQAIKAVLKNDLQKAMEIADNWLGQS